MRNQATPLFSVPSGLPFVVRYGSRNGSSQREENQPISRWQAQPWESCISSQSIRFCTALCANTAEISLSAGRIPNIRKAGLPWLAGFLGADEAPVEDFAVPSGAFTVPAPAASLAGGALDGSDMLACAVGNNKDDMFVV